ncbi:MAG TPA: NifU family protein [Gemmataceae bacterium]
MSESDLKQRVASVLKEEVAPALALDGTTLEVVDVRDRVALVRFSGGCPSCPATVMTLLTGLEQELRRRVPEVEYLEAVP